MTYLGLPISHAHPQDLYEIGRYNQKLLLISAEQLTISNLISSATQNNSHNIKKSLLIKNNQKFTNSIKKNDEKFNI